MEYAVNSVLPQNRCGTGARKETFSVYLQIGLNDKITMFLVFRVEMWYNEGNGMQRHLKRNL